MDVDKAFDGLTSIASELRDALRDGVTEQDTRLQVIDRFLTTVLGWPHNSIRTEVNANSRFADYALMDDSNRCLGVLEAKKTGVLTVDTASQRKTDAKLGGRVLRPAMDGISQAMDYCADLGTAYAIVTDGNTWIFFRATRTDGLPPKEGRAIIFPNFTAVIDDFSTFYELLAPSSVSQKLHLARLSAVEALLSRPREARHFIRPSDEARLLPRTELGRDVAEVFNRFFAGISSEQDAEMRHICFVETRQSREADATLVKIASHLTKRYTAWHGGHVCRRLHAQIFYRRYPCAVGGRRRFFSGRSGSRANRALSKEP
jgi:hypothetical protein